MNKLEKRIWDFINEDYENRFEKWEMGEGRVKGFVNQIIEICSHYAKYFKYDPVEIFEALESRRDYSYPNYYQWANFPKLDEVTIFETEKDMMEKCQPQKGFRCPSCGEISKNPYRCDSGAKVKDLKDGKNKKCNWVAGGFFRTMDKGLMFTVKDQWIKNPTINECFMPVSMEK